MADVLRAVHGAVFDSPALKDPDCPPELRRAWERLQVDRLQRAMAKLAVYRIQSTPSLTIAGRYVVTPDDTQGDADLFLRLASGLLSKTTAPRSS